VGARQDEAYGRLCQSTRPVLTAYLRSKGLNRDDIEDVVECAFLKVWERRKDLTFPDAAHWFAYMKRVSDRLVIDLRRGGKARLETSAPPLLDVSDEAAHGFVDAIADVIERRHLERAADHLWLGDEPCDFHLKLLTAKMLVLDCQDWRAVAQVVRRAVLSCPDVDGRQCLLDWAGEVRVLRSLVVEALTYSGQDLAGLLLDCDSNAVQAIVGQVGSPRRSGHSGLTAGEVAIVVWKFYCFEPNGQVARRAEEAGFTTPVDPTIERFASRLPFLKTMRSIWDTLRETPNRETALAKPGVWKRLAFHYAVQGLPHLDLVAWIGPAADVAGFKLEAMTVHAWISNRRLVKELAAHLQRGQAEVARV